MTTNPSLDEVAWIQAVFSRINVLATYQMKSEGATSRVVEGMGARRWEMVIISFRALSPWERPFAFFSSGPRLLGSDVAVSLLNVVLSLFCAEIASPSPYSLRSFLEPHHPRCGGHLCLGFSPLASVRSW